jgi:protein-disulfide isomerase
MMVKIGQITPTNQSTLRAALVVLSLAIAFPAFAQDASTASNLRASGFAIGDMILGSEDAQVTIVKYTSFTCLVCGNFYNETWPDIMNHYVFTGQVKLIFREVSFDRLGLQASMVARCGGEDSFFETAEVLMERQAEWLRSTNPVQELQRIGRLMGLSNDRLQTCLTTEPFMLQLIADQQRNTGEDGVRSIPTFLINGERHSGFMSTTNFAALIEAHL